MNKSELKKIIKECIVELFLEMAGQEVPTPVQSESRRSHEPQQVQHNSPRNVGRDSLQETVRSVAGNDKILAEVLADTARTTLPSQLQADAPSRYSETIDNISSPSGAGISLDVLMPKTTSGSDNSHWADLAFATAKISK